jgi:hypothetical protein
MGHQRRIANVHPGLAAQSANIGNNQDYSITSSVTASSG